MTCFNSTLSMVLVECCTCHIQFAMTQEMNDAYVNDHKWWYCPKGHRQHYSGPSEETKLRRRLKESRACCVNATENFEATKRRLSATQGVVTRFINKRNHENFNSNRHLGTSKLK